MNAARFLCALAATGAFAGCAGDISLNLDLPSTFLLETGNYELELNDRAGGATVAAAVPGEALVLELDIPAAEVVSVVPVVAEPGGWIVRIDVTDIPHQYELLIAAKGYRPPDRGLLHVRGISDERGPGSVQDVRPGGGVRLTRSG
jgi:hypothetical protein